jgi:hypothetical protein
MSIQWEVQDTKREMKLGFLKEKMYRVQFTFLSASPSVCFYLTSNPCPKNKMNQN